LFKKKTPVCNKNAERKRGEKLKFQSWGKYGLQKVFPKGKKPSSKTERGRDRWKVEGFC